MQKGQKPKQEDLRKSYQYTKNKEFQINKNYENYLDTEKNKQSTLTSGSGGDQVLIGSTIIKDNELPLQLISQINQQNFKNSVQDDQQNSNLQAFDDDGIIQVNQQFNQNPERSPRRRSRASRDQHRRSNQTSSNSLENQQQEFDFFNNYEDENEHEKVIASLKEIQQQNESDQEEYESENQQIKSSQNTTESEIKILDQIDDEINSQRSFDKLSNREDFSEKSDDDKKLVLQRSRNLIELAESQAQDHEQIIVEIEMIDRNNSSGRVSRNSSSQKVQDTNQSPKSIIEENQEDMLQSEARDLNDDDLDRASSEHYTRSSQYSLQSIDRLYQELNKINENALNLLKNEETEAALDQLKRAEQTLEDYTNEGKEVDRNMIIVILYNQACCYQRLSILDDCANYLDGTIYNLDQKVVGFSEQQEQQLRDMIAQAEAFEVAGNFAQKVQKEESEQIVQHAYGLNGEAISKNKHNYTTLGTQNASQKGTTQKNLNDDNNSMDFTDQYGLQKKGIRVQNIDTLSQDLQNDLEQIQEPTDDGDAAGYIYQDQGSNDGQDVPTPGELLEQLEASKKLSISQKLFKLRYLSKSHLQLCAVKSQLNKHKEALHHGQMASIYCQELIRNSKLLCESYIGEILSRGKKEDDDLFEDEERELPHKLGEKYYLEDDRKLLDILIKNCHPIMSDLLGQVDRFNSYNQLIERSKRTRQLDQDIFRGALMQSLQQNRGEFSDGNFLDLFEFDQELADLLENKEEFSIIAETRKNISKFQENKQQIKKLFNQQKTDFDTLSDGKDIFGEEKFLENRLSYNERQSLLKRQKSQRQYVDEPNPFAVASKPKGNKEEVYYKNQQDNSFHSEGTYGQKNQDFLMNPTQSVSYITLQNNVKTVLVGSQQEDDWIFNLNIGNVMHLQPLSSEEMNLHVDNSHELSRDAILEKIILLTVSYFCVGTELRFLNNQRVASEQDEINKIPKARQTEIEKEKKKKKEQSEMWHTQALEASARFLPSECPLVAHVITNYQKHHAPALTIIQEDEELDERLKIVRPLNEVKNDNINYYQIIRDHFQGQPKAIKNEKMQLNPQNIKDVKKSQETPLPLGKAPMVTTEKPVHPKILNIASSNKKNIDFNEIQLNKTPKGFVELGSIMNEQHLPPATARLPLSSPQLGIDDPGSTISDCQDSNKIFHDNKTTKKSIEIKKFKKPAQTGGGTRSSTNSSGNKPKPFQFKKLSVPLNLHSNTNQQKTGLKKEMNPSQQSLNNIGCESDRKEVSGMTGSMGGSSKNSHKIKLKNKKVDHEFRASNISAQIANEREEQKPKPKEEIKTPGIGKMVSIKARLKMMPSSKSTFKLPINKNINQMSNPKIATKNSQPNLYATQKMSLITFNRQTVSPNNFLKNSKYQSTKSTANLNLQKSKLTIPRPTAVHLSASPARNKISVTRKSNSSLHGSASKAPKPQKQVVQSGLINTQLSIAQNIKKITEVLSQKISMISLGINQPPKTIKPQQVFNFSKSNQVSKINTPTSGIKPSMQRVSNQPLLPHFPNKLVIQSKKVQYLRKGDQKNSDSSEEETPIDERNHGHVDDVDITANDISAERPIDGPSQKFQAFHNVPKISGTSLNINLKGNQGISFQQLRQIMQQKTQNFQSSLAQQIQKPILQKQASQLKLTKSPQKDQKKQKKIIIKSTQKPQFPTAAQILQRLQPQTVQNFPQQNQYQKVLQHKITQQNIKMIVSKLQQKHEKQDESDFTNCNVTNSFNDFKS